MILYHQGASAAPGPVKDLPSGSPTIVGDSHHLLESCGLEILLSVEQEYFHNCLHTKTIWIFLFLPSPNTFVRPTMENWM